MTSDLPDPRAVLGELCRRLEIAFDGAMLAWEPGPRPEDGIWARHWYANVHRSSGFEPRGPKSARVPERLAPLLAECRLYYDELARHAITAA